MPIEIEPNVEARPQNLFLLIRHDDAACSKSTELWAVLVDFLPQCWRDYLSRVIFLTAAG
jgi:hypothetical protein